MMLFSVFRLFLIYFHCDCIEYGNLGRDLLNKVAKVSMILNGINNVQGWTIMSASLETF